MTLLRKILFPFAVLYGMITGIRNYLFDRGILKSYTFNVPIIAVGILVLVALVKHPKLNI
jgi:tetraacyldisaccharide 4'-kinase